MKEKIFLFVLISCIILFSGNLLSNSFPTENYTAYLTISFLNPKEFKDTVSQNALKANIENIVENEGIHIIHKEKPSEYKLYINVTISDSLVIEAKGIGAGDGASMIKVKRPKITYPYKSKKDIYNSIKSYIKEYL